MIEAWPALKVVAGEPAMTIVPNFLLTGMLAIVMGIIVTIWAGKFIEHKSGGLIPPFFGIAAGVIAVLLNYQTTS
jgi:hypothetical protein